MGRAGRLLGVASASAVVALACASLPPPPAARSDGFRYVDRRLGVALELPPGWRGYTSASELPPQLAGAIPRGFGPKPALIGMDPSGTALVRVLTERAPGLDARAYFEVLSEAAAAEVDVLDAAYAPDADTVRWHFRAGRGQLRFSFVETITVRNGHAIRVAFWTGSPFFSLRAEEFESIAAWTFLYGESGWDAPWRWLDAALDPSAFPDLDLAEPDADPIPACDGAPRGLLWEVHAGEGTAFLFPSIHAGHPHQYPLPAPIEEAFAASTRLVVEVDVHSPENERVLAAVATRKAAEPTAEQRARAETWLASLGMPFGPFDGQPAWLLAVGLELFQWQMEGFVPQFGIDKYFLDRAGEREVVELESAAEQVAVLERVGRIGLDHTLASLDDMPEQIRVIYAAWYCGDAAAVARATASVADARMPAELEQAVFHSRNEAMAERLIPLLDDPGVSFVTVGLGHFLGPSGIPALLEQRGYEVRRR